MSVLLVLAVSQRVGERTNAGRKSRAVTRGEVERNPSRLDGAARPARLAAEIVERNRVEEDGDAR